MDDNVRRTAEVCDWRNDAPSHANPSHAADAMHRTPHSREPCSWGYVQAPPGRCVAMRMCGYAHVWQVDLVSGEGLQAAFAQPIHVVINCEWGWRRSHCSLRSAAAELRCAWPARSTNHAVPGPDAVRARQACSAQRTACCVGASRPRLSAHLHRSRAHMPPVLHAAPQARQ